MIGGPTRLHLLARTGDSFEGECLSHISLFSWAPQISKATSWKCGLLATRVGEASHPGHSDILEAALSEANPLLDQVFPDSTHCTLEVSTDTGPVPLVAVTLPGPCPSVPAPVLQLAGALCPRIPLNLHVLVLPRSVVSGPLPSHQPWLEFVQRHEG